jgi:hypothetical protein
MICLIPEEPVVHRPSTFVRCSLVRFSLLCSLTYLLCPLFLLDLPHRCKGKASHIPCLPLALVPLTLWCPLMPCWALFMPSCTRTRPHLSDPVAPLAAPLVPLWCVIACLVFARRLQDLPSTVCCLRRLTSRLRLRTTVYRLLSDYRPPCAASGGSPPASVSGLPSTVY